MYFFQLATHRAYALASIAASLGLADAATQLRSYAAQQRSAASLSAVQKKINFFFAKPWRMQKKIQFFLFPFFLIQD